MKYLMTMLTFILATFSIPALAQSNIPAGTKMVLVLVGDLNSKNQTILTNPKTGSRSTVQLSDCAEQWYSNEPFVFIQSKSYKFYLIRAKRFFYYYDNSKDWAYTIGRVNNDGAICHVKYIG